MLATYQTETEDSNYGEKYGSRNPDFAAFLREHKGIDDEGNRHNVDFVNSGVKCSCGEAVEANRKARAEMGYVDVESFHAPEISDKDFRYSSVGSSYLSNVAPAYQAQAANAKYN